MSFDNMCIEIKFLIIKSISSYIDIVNISQVNRSFNEIYNVPSMKRYKFEMYIDLISGNTISECNLLSLLHRYLIKFSSIAKDPFLTIKHYCLKTYDNDMNIIINFKTKYFQHMLLHSIYLHLFCTSISKIICNEIPSNFNVSDILNKYYNPFELLSKYLISIVDSMFTFGYRKIIRQIEYVCDRNSEKCSKILLRCFNNIMTRTITYKECCRFVLSNVKTRNYTRSMMHGDCCIINYLYINNTITFDIRQRILYYIINVLNKSYTPEVIFQLCDENLRKIGHSLKLNYRK